MMMSTIEKKGMSEGARQRYIVHGQNSCAVFLFSRGRNVNVLASHVIVP